MTAPVKVPNLTDDAVCCPVCQLRVPFLANGLADWHTDPAGGLCAAVFPTYVVARDPQSSQRPRRPARAWWRR